MKNEGAQGGGGRSAFPSCMGYQEYKWDVVEWYVQVNITHNPSISCMIDQSRTP